VERQGVETFKRLGFTEYEARVLYTLLRLREADVRTIARHSEVPRTKVYEVLKKLVRNGLVTEIHSKPVRYAIINPEGFLDNLYKKKEEELKRLKTELNFLKNVLPIAHSQSKMAENYIVRMSSPEDFVEFIKKKIREPTIVGYTRESAKILKNLGTESYPSPVDFVLTPEELFIPLNPIGVPQREYIIVVFTNPYVMEMVRLWVEEVLSKS